MQRDIGLQSATDGEFRRTSWHMDFIYRLHGARRADDQITVKFHNDAGDIEFTSAALRRRRAGRHRRPDLRRGLRLPALTPSSAPRRSSPSPRRAWCTSRRCAAIDLASTRTRTKFWPTSAPPTRPRCAAARALGCTLSAARRRQPRLPERPAQRDRSAPAVTTPSTSIERYIRQINESIAVGRPI